MATTTATAAAGHDAHTPETQNQTGLPGKFNRPIKITVLGAGSAFTTRVLKDVLLIPGADRGQIALVDIDTTRLELVRQLIHRLICQNGREQGWSVTASGDRREVMADSDYIINCIEVSGVDCVAIDNDIPLKYGIDQCIGDTIGPGGLFKALRTVPVFLEMLKDAEELCPHAIVLNYTNPMNILCLAAGRVSTMSVVGLCHSVQGTSQRLAQRAGIPYQEMIWECAGINHLAWFTKLEHQGKDLYPILMDKARRDIEAGRALDQEDVDDLVRKDMMLHFGAFITESSGHLSEYLPYYRKRQDVMAKYCRADYQGGSRFYADNWPTWRKNRDAEREAMLRGEKLMDWPRSHEYASWIIEGREKHTPVRIHGNVMNVSRDGAGPLISNLPTDGCVEVACYVDENGLNPARFGKLPPQMAHVCASNMGVFDLAATACIERSKEAAIHALLLDPLTAAVCSPAEIKQMTLEMFDAQQRWLPGYC